MKYSKNFIHVVIVLVVLTLLFFTSRTEGHTPEDGYQFTIRPVITVDVDSEMLRGGGGRGGRGGGRGGGFGGRGGGGGRVGERKRREERKRRRQQKDNRGEQDTNIGTGIMNPDTDTMINIGGDGKPLDTTTNVTIPEGNGDLVVGSTTLDDSVAGITEAQIDGNGVITMDPAVWNAYRHHFPEGNDISALDITSGEPYDIDSEIEEKCKNSADGGDGDACVTEWVNGVDDPWLPRGAMRGTVEKCKQVCAGIPKCGGFVRTGELTPQYMDDNDFDEEDRAFATKIGSNMCGFFAKGTVDGVSADDDPFGTTYTKTPMEIYEMPDPSCESRTIRANRRGGKPPFTYLWSTGETGNSINPAQDGMYEVLVTDADNMKKSGSAIVGPGNCYEKIILNIPSGVNVGGNGSY